MDWHADGNGQRFSGARRGTAPASRVSRFARIVCTMAGVLIGATSVVHAQGALSNGANQSGVIASAGEIDSWTFTASIGNAISISVGEIGPDSALYPWIRLRRPDGVEIASNYGALVAQVDVTAPLSGTYTVLVASADSGHDDTGDYSITMALTPAAFVVSSGDEGGPIANGENYAGHIFTGDLDLWSFTAAKGEALSVSVGEVLTSEIDPGFYPWLRLLGPDGTALGSNYGALVAQVDIVAPLSGTYTVVVGTADSGRDATGDYLLTLARSPAAFTVPDGDEGGPLGNGTNNAGHIHVGDLDQWSFTAAKGDYISVSVGEKLDGEVDPGFYPWLRLRGPDGTELGSNYGAWVAQIDRTAPLSGTYTVVVGTADSGRDATGDYLLTLAKSPGSFTVPAGDEGGPLTNGANYPGHIYRGDLDQWSFAAAKGDALSLSVGEVLGSEIDPGFYPWIRLIGPDGTALGSNYGAWVGAVDVTAPLTGTYIVVIGTADSGRDAVGDYRLTLAQTPGAFVVPAGDDGGAMANHVEYAGSIFVGDLDQWTFNANAGADVTVTMTEPPPGEVDPGFYPWIRVRRPDGTQIASNYGAVVAQASFKAPLTGLYTIVTGTADSGRDATGNYTLRVDGAAEPVTTYTVTPSPGPGGTMAPGTPQTVVAGATISFTMHPSTGYELESVGGSCAGTLAGAVFTTAAVTGDCTVAATFRLRTNPPALPTMSVDKTSLHYAAVTSGPTFVQQTAAQIVRLLQSGAGAVTWTATPSVPWLTVTPASGVGPVELALALVPSAGVPSVGTIGGVVTLTFAGAANGPLAIDVSLSTLSVGSTDNPFGVVDTPADFSTGVTGAIPFTGWGLDDVQVDAVVICRGSVSFEGAVADARCGNIGQLFIGEAVFIDRARPDVEAAYPGYPLASRGGWGFMVLTNMLPDIPRGLPTGGNGTFTFYMYARDVEGHLFRIGTRTMTCDNDHATLPFGAIDTPGQGAVVAGSSYVNFGWALTQNPKAIPIDGSTIHVYVDGTTLGTVSYNNYRSDIATFFPGLANSNGAVGFRVLDTTGLANGLHTIAWGVADDTGAFTGIGSRFFSVANSATALTAAAGDPLELPSEAESGGELAVHALRPRVSAADAAAAVAAEVEAAPIDRRTIAGRRDWNPDGKLRDFVPADDGRVLVRGEELDRIELFMGAPAGETLAGYLRAGSLLAPLPAGSAFDASTGVFTWAPGVGFVGRYDLVFVRSRDGVPTGRQDVRIVLLAKGANRRGPQVVIDSPRRQQDVGQPFIVQGWAADLDAASGSGIATLHVWAYPHGGGAPVFLGVADRGATRPDVATVYGDQFRSSGYTLKVSGLRPGIYDLAVFGWSEVMGGFAPAATVQVVVRP